MLVVLVVVAVVHGWGYGFSGMPGMVMFDDRW